jgi:hypothetical protein
MSKQSNNISISGTVSNLLDEGFDKISSLKEITDNSIGVGTKRIKFFINLKTLTVYVMDDGTGMNKQKLTKLATLNDRKEVSRAKQGKYGQGLKLAFAFLTQNKHLVTIISKTTDHGPKEDDLNQIEINFAESIKTGEYDPRAERVSHPNENLWKKLSGYFNTDNLANGTLIEIKMEKRLFKDFYRTIISTEISASGNILYEMVIINQNVLKDQNVSIDFHIQNLVTDNEPEMVFHQSVSVEYTSDDDKSVVSSEDQQVVEVDSASSANVFDDNVWDVECSENYEKHYQCPSINLLDNAEEDQKHTCYVLENTRGDKKFLLKRNGGFNEITVENLNNLSKKPKILIGNIEELSVKLNYKIKDTFVISLAYNEDWIAALQSELTEIIGNIFGTLGDLVGGVVKFMRDKFAGFIDYFIEKAKLIPAFLGGGAIVSGLTSLQNAIRGTKEEVDKFDNTSTVSKMTKVVNDGTNKINSYITKVSNVVIDASLSWGNYETGAEGTLSRIANKLLGFAKNVTEFASNVDGDKILGGIVSGAEKASEVLGNTIELLQGIKDKDIFKTVMKVVSDGANTASDWLLATATTVESFTNSDFAGKMGDVIGNMVDSLKKGLGFGDILGDLKKEF